MISAAATLPDYKEWQKLSLQMNVFIGRHFETNQKGVGKTECRLQENKISPQTNKTLQITTGQEKNQAVALSHWISKKQFCLDWNSIFLFSFVDPSDNY